MENNSGRNAYFRNEINKAKELESHNKQLKHLFHELRKMYIICKNRKSDCNHIMCNVCDSYKTRNIDISLIEKEIKNIRI